MPCLDIRRLFPSCHVVREVLIVDPELCRRHVIKVGGRQAFDDFCVRITQIELFVVDPDDFIAECLVLQFFVNVPWAVRVMFTETALEDDEFWVDR